MAESTELHAVNAIAKTATAKNNFFIVVNFND
jgi:hypothetical protein